MDRIKGLQGPILAGAIWIAVTLAEWWLRESGGAVLLVWLPSAVAVAALYSHDRRRWPAFLGAIAVAQVAISTASGQPIVSALGLAAASTTQSVLTTWIGIWGAGGSRMLPHTLRHFAILFAAALLGSAACALIAYPFGPGTDAEELAWRFLASALGVLIGVPILLHLRQWLGFGSQRIQMRDDQGRISLLATTLGMFVVAAFVLQFCDFALLWVLVVVQVLAVIRHGQFGAALAVMAMVTAGTLVSFGGNSPAAFLPYTPAIAGLLLQVTMLGMLAMSLPIAAMLLARNRLEAQMRETNAALEDSLTTLRLAESLVGIGCWHYDFRSKKQTWSEQMLDISGLPRELAPDPGEVRDLLSDGGEVLFGEIARHRDSREPYSFEYGIRTRSGTERILRIVVTNEFDEQGERIALFAVAMDATEQVRREEALEIARNRAVVLAAEAQQLAMTDALTELANRRCTLETLERMLKTCARSGEPMALVMFDIDHFKAINDGYGHQTGDAVLVRVAQLAREQVRAGDLVGRIGGEEFVWLLPAIVPAQARELAERLRETIEHGSAEGGLPQVTVSLGLAQSHPGDTAERLLARADGALYEAKEEGRNCVHRAA